MTGSAHTVLAPYWSGLKGGARQMRAWQCSPRGGVMDLELVEEEGLRAAGSAVIVLEGVLKV